MPSISVISFNVLAPCWVSSLYNLLLLKTNRYYRRERIIRFLNKNKCYTDVFCLQECTDEEFCAFKQELKDEYFCYMSHHDSSYWLEWLGMNRYEPNGNGIFIKKSKFKDVTFSDVALACTGNHCAVIKCKERKSNRQIRIFAIHLDNDVKNRRDEFESFLDCYPKCLKWIDIVAGDFNCNVERFKRKDGYINVIQDKGNTLPLNIPLNEARLDHILVRRAEPIEGKILDQGIRCNVNPIHRLHENMDYCGSDHYPVFGKIRF